MLLHPLVVTAAVSLCGSVAPQAPLPALAVALLWAALFLRTCKRRRRIGLLLAGLFLTCGTRAVHALDDFKDRYFELREALPAPSRCAGIARVTRSPVIRSRTEGESVVIWSGQTSELDCEGTLLPPTAVRIYGGPQDLSRGDKVEFVAQLGAIRLFRNAGLPDPWPGAARRAHLLSGGALFAERSQRGTGLSSSIDRARAKVRRRIQATYPEPVSPLGRALVLGENDLQEEDAEAFRQSGLLHLLAVSGTHLVLAVLALVQALGAIFVRIAPLAQRYDVRRFSSLLGALLSLLYADFSGGSGSAWRAAFMLCVVCGGRALGLKVRGAAALGASLLVGLLLDPLVGSDYSFLLSALATSGLIGLGQPLAEWANRGLFRRAPLRQLAVSFIATISSTLPCAPVLAMMDGDMTVAALFANVVAGPFGELIALPACLAHAIASGVPALESGLALVGSGALYAVRAIALWSASVEQAQFPVPLPSPWNVAFLLSTAAIVLTRRHSRTLVALCAAPLACLTCATQDPQEGRLAVTALDVGQGDALLIDFPDGKVGLMDGGGFATGIPDTGRRVILPVLRARHIDHLDVMLLSHPHPDHMLGLLSVAEEVSIGELWVPHLPKRKDGALAELVRRAKARGARVHSAGKLCGERTWGGATIEVLAPCGDNAKTWGANDASLVVRLSHGRHRALLTGDIEEEAEGYLVATAADRLDADFLKVAHHGSDTSSDPVFIDAVTPKVAFISSGVRNRFNHPRPKTLATLSSRRIAVLRTDRLGSLTWMTDGQNQSVSSFSSGPPQALTEDFTGEAYFHPRRALSHLPVPSSLGHAH